jgi:hypothetical protein
MTFAAVWMTLNDFGRLDGKSGKAGADKWKVEDGVKRRVETEFGEVTPISRSLNTAICRFNGRIGEWPKDEDIGFQMHLVEGAQDKEGATRAA